MITKEDVQKIARLARVEITPEEEGRMVETISQVLGYMDILREVDTSQVKITSQVTGLHDIVREDIPIKSEITKELREQMPEVYAEELVVPGVFNDK
jgi:aspartyl-tRNA(Asn)/glutamyl-tRNA(Gln) amidotransferase subunit C